jgi:hypothetical protein
LRIKIGKHGESGSAPIVAAVEAADRNWLNPL